MSLSLTRTGPLTSSAAWDWFGWCPRRRRPGSGTGCWRKRQSPPLASRPRPGCHHARPWRGCPEPRHPHRWRGCLSLPPAKPPRLRCSRLPGQWPRRWWRLCCNPGRWKRHRWRWWIRPSRSSGCRWRPCSFPSRWRSRRWRPFDSPGRSSRCRWRWFGRLSRLTYCRWQAHRPIRHGWRRPGTGWHSRSGHRRSRPTPPSAAWCRCPPRCH